MKDKSIFELLGYEDPKFDSHRNPAFEWSGIKASDPDAAYKQEPPAATAIPELASNQARPEKTDLIIPPHKGFSMRDIEETVEDYDPLYDTGFMPFRGI